MYLGVKYIYYNCFSKSFIVVFPGGSESKESTCTAGDLRPFPWLERSPGEGYDNPTPVFLPGESHGQKSLAGYSPWGHKQSDMAERPLKKNGLQKLPERGWPMGWRVCQQDLVLLGLMVRGAAPRNTPQEQRGGSSHLLPCLFPCYCHSRSPHGALGEQKG